MPKLFFKNIFKACFKVSLAIFLLITILRLSFADKTNKFIRYFPNYNPFIVEQIIAYTELTPNQKPNLEPATSSRLLHVKLAFDSQSQRSLIIYLPKNYNQEASPKYPVLILLHGSPGQETDWLEAGKAVETLDKLINDGSIKPLIVVFPDGNGGVNRDTQYINSTDNRAQNETFIVSKVLDYVHQNFATLTDAKHTAIGGLSSGGFGALNLGLKHQNIFGNIMAFSGYAKIEQNPESQKLIQHSHQTIEANSPTRYISKLQPKTVKIWLCIGAQDPFFLSENKALQALLQKNNFKSEIHIENGTHSWDFWANNLPNSLVWLDQQW